MPVNIGASRNTRFEIQTLTVEANAVKLRLTERGTYGAFVDVTVPETALTEQQVTEIREGFEVLEIAAEAIYEAAQAAPAAVMKAKRDALEAQRAAEAARVETLRLELENIAKRAEAEQLDTRLAESRRALAAIEATQKLITPTEK